MSENVLSFISVPGAPIAFLMLALRSCNGFPSITVHFCVLEAARTREKDVFQTGFFIVLVY